MTIKFRDGTLFSFNLIISFIQEEKLFKKRVCFILQQKYLFFILYPQRIEKFNHFLIITNHPQVLIQKTK